VADFARFLLANPRYRAALNQQDPQAFVAALAAGGYATDPAYAHKAGAIARGESLRAALATYRDLQVAQEDASREQPELKNSSDAPIGA
jgi:flagellum-specific peptidoglycan hydrolase FlgJ